jgi:ABC-type Fe3+ transport system permease subunit
MRSVRIPWRVWLAVVAACCDPGCGGDRPEGVTLVFSGSAVGAEGRVLRAQVRGFQALHPGIGVVVRPTPDAAEGATRWQILWHVTLPMLRPAIAVAVLFRTLDALRVFDLIYVLTGGGPGTATEPVALYTFGALFQNLRFGYGAALSVVIFLLTFLAALFCIRVLGADLGGRR